MHRRLPAWVLPVPYPEWLDGEYEFMRNWNVRDHLGYYAGAINPADFERITGPLLVGRQRFAPLNDAEPSHNDGSGVILIGVLHPRRMMNIE